jgi:nucleotide-binding universal stress UspA family protein
MNADAAEPPNTVRPKHILAPVDFSQPCLHGLTAALDLARRFDAKLTVVHVVKHLPHGSHVVLDAVGIQQDWERPARERLAEFVAEHVPKDVSVRQVVAVGKPFHKVVELATELECDLIVISMHGYTGLAHVLIGSNAERIVQHAPCPVLVVRGRPDENSPSARTTAFRWILLPTDFSENSCKAFPLAAAMLAHVSPAVTTAGEIPMVFFEQDLVAERAKAEVQLRQFRSEHFSEELNTTTVVLEGVPHQALCEMAKADDPGLIVIATHGHTGWEHALMGSTAERVVRHAPCPVLVVR